MKCFICAFRGVNLGIPAGQTERIIPASQVQGEKSISIPVLFKLENPAPVHGMVLKDPVDTILLAPKIDIEMDIPQNEIHSLPRAFAGLFAFFTGVYLSDQKIIFILDPKKLAEGVK